MDDTLRPDMTKAAKAPPPPGERVLPPLRPDLRLIEGEGDGHQPWKIHDPLAQRFFEVDQDAVDLLSCWSGGTVDELRARAATQLGREFSEKSVITLLEFLYRNELLQAVAQVTWSRVEQQRARMRDRPIWQRLIHGYLFIKVPLARPDRFLRATQHAVGFIFHPAFWWFLGAAGLLSLYLVSRQWEAFRSTLPEMFTAAGVVTFGISLGLVKTLHELGHGYAAVRMGSRITTMGVAFIVMMPVLYTDTTDAWRLRSHRQRVLIDAAGMAVELIVAVIATYVWVLVPDGPARHAAFALATTGWVLSIAVNCNPLMRFDGYYLFSDLVNVPNLQERSFAMGKWWLRELLFGYGDKAPPTPNGHTRAFFIGFAFAVWIYRFFLFLGIALLVYHFFFKILGIVMFAVEMGWFIVLPIWREVRVWLVRRRESGARVRVTAFVVLAMIAVFVVPLPYKVRVPAVLTAAQQVPSFAPQPSRIDEILVRPGDHVKAGQVMLRLSAPELDQNLATARDRARLLDERMARRTSDIKDRAESLVLARELRMERDRIDGLQRERARLVVQAPIDGVVMDVALELHPGRWIDARTQLVLVGRPEVLEARGYVDSEDLERIAEGNSGRFVDEERMMPPLDAQVRRIGAAASDTLDNWVLASVHGGPVAARLEGKKAKAEHATFEVTAAVARPDNAAPMEIRGELQLKGAYQSLAVRVFERVAHVLVREGAA
ncbi:HlyD family efflux transporter periplasmic adaptor subunit [Variovorax sp. dw_308]|uniref:HlyD family efflux transporter periplasmic adaptor subunit n=1 Tax=Variovorax sp. dw_308 TaxID=2721546 RepID=UPI001C4846E2|nr:HlyD family efflux transporter periplasmic adaptor subunit [Variovorax sp. dw_308]